MPRILRHLMCHVNGLSDNSWTTAGLDPQAGLRGTQADAGGAGMGRLEQRHLIRAAFAPDPDGGAVTEVAAPATAG
jgi:hypothetical protein